MRTRTNILAVFAVTALSVIIAGAQERSQQKQPIRKVQEFNCPVCGSPCLTKADLVEQRKMIRKRANARQNMQQNRGARLPQNPNARQRNAGAAPRPRQNGTLRFDIDGNGKLSTAEQTARRAYVQARRQNRRGNPDTRPNAQHPAVD